ncbi:MAG TPA: glutaminyl-peptide cyclotransferase [Pseudonocardia sp.]|nr:glutaminyl-peptide cyclotransferase [Pseudonocardia sp.]
MPVPVTRALVAGLLAGALCGALSGCRTSTTGHAADQAAASSRAITEGLSAGVLRLHPVVLGTLPHDTTAWTEGLEIDGDTLYESTGRPGHSALRELDPDTGLLRRATPLPDGLYGEGLTALGARIWQLTWRDGVALDWDRATRSPVRRLPWAGEGWGLCHTGDGRVIASDGTDRLRVLSGTDLAPLGGLPVRIAGRPLPGLNELECTPGTVWANVYQTDWIARIDPATGNVTGVVDATGLLPAGDSGAADGAVLNGIAAIPGTDQFLLTGKLWPSMFRVRFAG